MVELAVLDAEVIPICAIRIGKRSVVMVRREISSAFGFYCSLSSLALDNINLSEF